METYLNNEIYCHIFVQGIKSQSAIFGMETPNLPYFKNKPSLVW